MFRWIAPALMHGAWFEKSLFTWGWATGARRDVSPVRMVDPVWTATPWRSSRLAHRLPVAPLGDRQRRGHPADRADRSGVDDRAVGWTAAGLVAPSCRSCSGWTAPANHAHPTTAWRRPRERAGRRGRRGRSQHDEIDERLEAGRGRCHGARLPSEIRVRPRRGAAAGSPAVPGRLRRTGYVRCCAAPVSCGST
ncbi:hypothetical protein HBB16_03135 [Pseudonocardia sp. MCCB 268]|nr:hypothetical protein [Pseudonocardia cytotoxica]